MMKTEIVPTLVKFSMMNCGAKRKDHGPAYRQQGCSEPQQPVVKVTRAALHALG